MANYNERYIYRVEMEGATDVIAQLREIQALLANTRGQINTGNNAGNDAGGGGGNAPNFLERIGTAARWGIVSGIAFGLTGAVFNSIEGAARGWYDANRQLSDSLAELQVKMGTTRIEAEAYWREMQRAAFASGQDLSESVYARSIEQRVNRPGLASGAIQFGMVFPEVDVQTATNNLLALSIQFGASFGDINEVLLDTVQASGLTADELLRLSDTWGPLSQELGMVDKNGQRTAQGMRDISGLMAGMATVMGESGSTIENFLRKMSNFYTSEDIKAFLGQRGIETVTGKTAGGIDIRVPFMDLMNQISAQSKAEPGFAVALQEFFPNQLGQPTQQQLQELIRNWDEISGVIQRTNDTASEWANAVDVSSRTVSIATERLKVAFSGLFAAIGGDTALYRFINTLASAFQNQAVRMNGPEAGYVRAYDTREVRMLAGQGLESIVERRAGDNLADMALERRTSEMLRNLMVPQDVADAGPNAMARYSWAAVQAFTESSFFNPRDNGTAMAQAFISFIEQAWNEDVAVYGAIRGDSATQIAYKAGQPAGMGISTPSEARFTDIYADTSDEVDTLGNSSYLAASSIMSMAGAADAAFSLLHGASVSLPKGVGYQQWLDEYTKLMTSAANFSSLYGVNPGAKIEPTTIFDENGIPVTIMNVDESVARIAAGNANSTNQEIERASKEQEARDKEAMNRADARSKRLEAIFRGMVDAITTPTSVTASDLMFNAPGGKYQNKWDEPVRQMRADVNNLIAGKNLEYNFGGGIFGDIFTPEILAFAKGADQGTKEAIMRDLQAQAEKSFYSFTLPPEAYMGSKDALIASAQEWIAGKRNEKANRSMMEGWLKDAGLGPEAMAFLDEAEEPPILKMLTGGKTKEEMTTLFSEKIPNVSDSVAKGAKDVEWVTIIATAITKKVKDDEDPLIAAGGVMGIPMAKGAAAAFVQVITPQIIAAVLAGLPK